MRKIFELLNIGQIPYVIAADLCLINVILGLSGHGGKKVCCYCEAEKGMEAGEIRTFSRLKLCHDSFIEAGGKKENAQKFANCIHPPLLSVQGDPEVLDVIPPPELHLLMGAVNIKLELLRMILETIGMEQKLWDWCDSKGITRRGKSEIIFSLYPLLIPGYNGKNKLNGNNATRFLKKVEDLKMCQWFPSQVIPIVDILLTFKEVKGTCFG